MQNAAPMTVSRLQQGDSRCSGTSQCDHVRKHCGSLHKFGMEMVIFDCASRRMGVQSLWHILRQIAMRANQAEAEVSRNKGGCRRGYDVGQGCGSRFCEAGSAVHHLHICPMDWLPLGGVLPGGSAKLISPGDLQSHCLQFQYGRAHAPGISSFEWPRCKT